MKDSRFQPCAAWAEKLAATHPDDLSLAERHGLETHIACCPACAAVRFEYHWMDTLIRDISTHGPLFNIPPPPLKSLELSGSHEQDKGKAHMNVTTPNIWASEYIPKNRFQELNRIKVGAATFFRKLLLKIRSYICLCATVIEFTSRF